MANEIELREAWNTAVRAGQYADWEQGILGDVVDSKRQSVYVSIVRNGAITGQVTAFNRKVPYRKYWRVWVAKDPEGHWEVVGSQNSYAMEQYANSAPAGDVGQHSHDHPKFGLYDPVSTHRIKELQTIIYTIGTGVFVRPGRYHDTAGNEQTFDGAALDLSALVPSTSNYHVWAKVGLDTTSGTLTAGTSTPQSITLPLLPTTGTSIDLGAGVVALSLVKLTNGETVDEWGEIIDWRFPFTQPSDYIPVDTHDVSNPPTDAELDGFYGTPGLVGSGFRRFIDDNGGGTAFYMVASDGSHWFTFTGTKAT